MKESHRCIHDMEKELYQEAIGNVFKGHGWVHPMRHEKSTAHVFAKFGRTPGFFANEIAQHDREVRDMFPTRFGYHTFPDWILEDERWTEHLEFTRNNRTNGRGGGYWFWKPLLIQQLLDEGYPWVIYSDVDRSKFSKWTKQAMALMDERNATFAIERTAATEDVYSHPVTQQAICGKMLHDKQYNANLLIMKNTPNIRQMVDDWVDFSANFTLLSVKGVPMQGKTFKDHRFDQTLISLILKCRYQERGMELMPKTCNRRRLSSFQIWEKSDKVLLQS